LLSSVLGFFKYPVRFRFHCFLDTRLRPVELPCYEFIAGFVGFTPPPAPFCRVCPDPIVDYKRFHSVPDAPRICALRIHIHGSALQRFVVFRHSDSVPHIPGPHVVGFRCGAHFVNSDLRAGLHNAPDAAPPHGRLEPLDSRGKLVTGFYGHLCHASSLPDKRRADLHGKFPLHLADVEKELMQC
jgi:hypothetical protein